MDDGAAVRYAAVYLGISIIAGAVGLAVAAGGVAIGGLAAVDLYREGWGPLVVLRTAGPGLALIGLGVLIWWFGNAVAVYKTFTAAVDATIADRLDTEALKSDVLAVLDERLAEMHQEVSQTRRLVDRLSREESTDEFDFDDDFDAD